MNGSVKLSGVSKRFGEGHTAVQALCDVSFEIPGGAMAVVAGPSGSGKTTLLNVTGVLEQPDVGRVEIGGEDLAAEPERVVSRFRRAHLGFVFQQFNLLRDLTAGENIELPLVLNGVPPQSREPRVKELLERLGLPRRANAFPIELSAGEQQRVAIARAVAHRPSLILADEPTANLDSANARAVVELLVELHREEQITVLLATHDPLVIEIVKARIFLRDGRVERIEGLPRS